MLLKPNKEEKESDFINRFATNAEMITDFPDKKQRLAIAVDQWERYGENGHVQGEFSHFEHNMSALIKKKTIGGREFFVAPVKMMPVECVMNGKFYQSSATESSVDEWNGRAVVVYHPDESVSANTPEFLTERQIGLLFNSHIKNGFLCAEAHIDIERASKLPMGAKVIAKLSNNENIDVSTGMKTKGYFQSGNAFGRDYEFMVSSFTPDHLALLPDQKGASSWEDGAGFARNNVANNKPNNNQEQTKMERKELMALLESAGIIAANQREELEKLDEKGFVESLKTSFEANKKAIEDGIAAKSLLDDEIKKDKTKVSLNAEDKALLAWAKVELNKKKDTIISGIVANKDCGYTKEELQAKNIDELEKLETLVKSLRGADYSGAVGGGNANNSGQAKDEDVEFVNNLNNPKK